MIVFKLVQRYGWEGVGLVVLIAGAVQLTAGAVKLGQWFRAVSPDWSRTPMLGGNPWV